MYVELGLFFLVDGKFYFIYLFEVYYKEVPVPRMHRNVIEFHRKLFKYK